MNKAIDRPPIARQRQQQPRADRPNQTAKQVPQFQSIAVFSGRLHVEGDHLHFRCCDGALLRICGIDPKFSLWLMSRPGELFSPSDRDWIVYPKCNRGGYLTVNLKSLCQPDREPPLPVDTAKIVGKLLAADGERMTIGVRRNLSPAAFKELADKGMIQGTEFDQFTVNAWGQPSAEVGSIIQINCRRDGDRLTLL